MWWLCRELFFDDPHRDTISLVALALVAISPIHVLYAQEAREYSLWTALMLASSALLLRAQRSGGWKWWAAYALSLALGLYTHTLFLLLWLAHATFIGGLCRQRRPAENPGRDRIAGNRLPAFGGATLGAALLFLPWALQIGARQFELSSNSAWLAQSCSVPYLLKTWVFLLATLFFDPNQTRHWSLDSNLLVGAVRLARGLFFLLMAGMLFFVGRHATRRSALFIIALAIVPFLALAIPDAALGGYRSTIARFMIPAFLGMQLAAAYSIAVTLRAPSTSRRSAAVCGVLLFAGLLSCLLSSQAEVWWNKSASYNVPRVARIVNAAEKPLLVVAPNPKLFALCRLLKPQVRLLVLRADQTHGDILPLLQSPQKATAVFLYRPAPQLRAALQGQGAHLNRSPAGDDLLLLEKS